MSKKNIFITATDTGVGKTFITALLAKALKDKGVNVLVVKCVSTGKSHDAEFIKNFSGIDTLLKDISPFNFKLPLAPLSASRQEPDVNFSKKKLINHIKNMQDKSDFFIVEGIGGVMVPIFSHYYVSDLIKELGYGCIVVSRPNLGTLNHTLLTINELKNKNINILGIVLNYCEKINSKKDISIKTNAEVIEQESGVKILAEVPYFQRLSFAEDYVKGINIDYLLLRDTVTP